MVDKFGFRSYESKLSDGDYLDSPSNQHDVSIHLQPIKTNEPIIVSVNESDVIIETYEEITEDSLIPKLVDRYVTPSFEVPMYSQNENTSINQILENNKVNNNISTHFYSENEFGELQLLWKNGKLVD